VVPGGINHDTADIDGVTVIDADHGKVVIVRRTYLMIVWRVSYGITACNDFRFGLYIADSRVLVNSVIELRLGAEIDSCDLVTASFIRVIGHNVNHAVHRMAQNRMGAFVYSPAQSDTELGRPADGLRGGIAFGCVGNGIGAGQFARRIRLIGVQAGFTIDGRHAISIGPLAHGPDTRNAMTHRRANSLITAFRNKL
jgi:hypothetical protein